MKKIIIAIIFFNLIVSFSCENNKKFEEEIKTPKENKGDKFTSLPRLSSPPKLIKRPEGTYPPSTEDSEKKVKVAVKVSVGIDGKVFDAEALWVNNKKLGMQAESLAYHYLFERPVYEGKTLPVTFVVSVVFNPDSIQQR